nr:ArsA family ATPase [Halomicroarcula sp. GDY20]
MSRPAPSSADRRAAAPRRIQDCSARTDGRDSVYGGKGGVGKTTVATATGLTLADRGHETLVVSTDPAHSLSDAVETPVGSDPTEITDGLWAVEVDPEAGNERYRALFEALADEFESAGIRLDADEVAALFSSCVLPGSDELAALDALATHVDDDRWDRVVFDTAPTGHAPPARPPLGDGARAGDGGRPPRTGPPEGRHHADDAAARWARDDDGDGTFVEMRDRLAHGRRGLRDPQRTEFRVVAIPETMAARGERAGRPVAGVRGPGDDARRQQGRRGPRRLRAVPGETESQRAALADLRESLPALDCWTVPDEHGEVTGLAALERVADHLDV